jgi:hypothetical protein
MKKIDTEQIPTNINPTKRPSKEDNSFLHSVVESAELVACDDQGTPIIGEDGEKICNCAEPWQSHFPDNKYYCLNCWGEWYH